MSRQLSLPMNIADALPKKKELCFGLIGLFVLLWTDM